jgi:hypothetical protein
MHESAWLSLRTKEDASMTPDLEDVHCEWLIDLVPKTQNTSPLIEHLRRDGKVTPNLKTLIANILDGTIKAKRKKETLKDLFVITDVDGNRKASVYLTRRLDIYREMLRNPTAEKWEQTKNLLTLARYVGIPTTKGDITKAAKKILAYSLAITDAQLDEFLSPRKARAKSQ